MKSLALIAFIAVFAQFVAIISGQTCPSGNFWNGCDNGCEECPRGMFCSGSSNPPLPCPAGTYSNLGSSSASCVSCPSGSYAPQKGMASCLPCPAGFSCTSTTATPCPEGRYSLSGSSSCSNCPAGQYCPSSDVSPIDCPPGTYSLANSVQCTRCTSPTSYQTTPGSSSCQSCPSSKTCVDPSESPQDCPLGTYIDSGSPNVCKECPAGKACPTVSSTPVSCGPGTYSPGGAIQTCLSCPSGYYSTGSSNVICLPCPSGYDCSSGTSATICAPGKYSPALASECRDCPAGTYQDQSGQSGCKKCPPGSKCEEGASSPVSCGAGFFSNPLDSSECLQCPPGTWSNPSDNFATCSPCDAGYRCPGDGSRTVCASGTYSLGGASTCDPCPAGYSCSSTSSVPQLCTSGYSLSGSTTCSPCPQDHECLDPTKSPVSCETGEYSPLGNDLCLSCPAGKICDGGAETTCDTGYYSLGGSSSCTICPPGYMCPVPTNAPISCRPGFYSASGAVECTPCPAGSYCPDTTSSPIACGSGSFSLPASTECIPCLPGFYCPSSTSLSQIPCAQGTYSTGGAASCTDCPAGKACPSPKGGEVTCSPGYYSLGKQITCFECPAGFQCSDATSSPEACPAGTYSGVGSTSCIACPSGYFCPKPELLPQLCPAGMYSTGSSTECTECDSGYTCGIGSSTPTPDDGVCPTGYYCPQGSLSAQPCPAGMYGIKSGGISILDACETCPPGYFCELGTPSVKEYNLCPPGHYCPSGTRWSTEFPCAAGTFLDAFGATGEEQCVTCPEGYYCPAGSKTYKTHPCHPGYYCPTGTGRANQFVCPAGTFNDVKGKTSLADCKTCPAGHSCNGGTDTSNPSSNLGTLGLSNPVPCSRGQYKSTVGTGTCSNCPAGYPCPFSGTADPYKYFCRPGHYCPAGSNSETMYLCPPGTFTHRYGARSINECQICPRGFYCPAGTGGPSPPLSCAKGHYCPGAPLHSESNTNEYYGSSFYVGTKREDEYPCPPGTYSPRNNIYSVDQCLPCPAGYWCAGGSNKWNGDCSPGHYCPEGSHSPTMYPCPAGTYSNEKGLVSFEQCLPCPKGSYCGSSFTKPVPCPVGTYTNITNTIGMGPSNDTTSMMCMECPAGSYCPLGSEEPIPCGVSNYSPPGQGCCSVCEIGHYCPLNTTSEEAMWNDYRCPAGLYCAKGQGPIPTTYANACPVGHFCVEATLLPEECPPGTYAPNTGLKNTQECLACPAGYYCSGGKAFIDGKCSPGYYCPENSSISTPLPCPRGMYREREGAEDEHQCNICPNGFYCEEATVNPIPCPAGYYCIVGSYEPESCPIGTYSNTTGLKEPEECTPCPAGLYCDGIGATQPSGLCDPGFYCIGGAFTSAPPDPPTGGLCPRGGYCQFGSSYPTTCEEGTYNNFTGGRSQDDCYACPPGFYCAGSNLPLPSGPCSAGWYCTGGAGLPTQHEAGPGTYTEEGASEPIPCPRGTYGIASKQASCADCPEGNYCPYIGGTNYTLCTAGHYCPRGSEYPSPCPEGTYAFKTGLKNESQCLACDPGSYCSGTGRTSVSGPCLEGYYCPSGSSVPNPPAYVCPEGFYCPNGTVDPIACPKGTFSPSTMLTNVSQCIACSGGSYCDAPGLKEVAGDCSAGFYCVEGADTPTPVDNIMGNICPTGSHCPPRSSQPIPCSPGKFTGITGQSQCFNCPKGYYCPSNTTDPILCPIGSYCPEETTLAIPKCPPGSYNPYEGLESEDECLLCPPGRVCSVTGLDAPDGQCQAGFICYSGAMNTVGALGVLGGESDDCPEGHYCPQGVIEPIPCPIGTFRNITGGALETDCFACTEGKYCPTVGIINPVLDCAAGYYCVGGAKIAKPLDGVTGDLCPKGKYCRAGTSTPSDCPVGSYSNILGLDSCLDCPEGHYCDVGTIDPEICPEGRYCPLGTEEVPPSCPPGSFSNQTGLTMKSECTLCTGGSYCSIAGLTAPNGLCKAGYYCVSGSTDEEGALGELGGVTGECPAGHYCISGTIVPEECPPGTFSPDMGNIGLGNCTKCLPGKFCPLPAQTNATDDCDEGYYCILGASVAAPRDGITGDVCPTAHYCPTGSEQPIPCEESTYNDREGQAQCTICPSGYYCPQQTITPSECTPGYYCPEGTNSTLPPCPVGTYRNQSGGDSIDSCILCPGGFYCPSVATTDTFFPCSAGYYCYQGAIGNDGEVGFRGGEGGVCPPGHYCPEESELPTACPNGTFRGDLQGGDLVDCYPCEAGKYCEGVGLTTPTGNCSAGYYCPEGQTVSAPPQYICQEGYYCPEGSSFEFGCPGGSYQPGKGEFDCHKCPEGFFCRNNASVPEICPTNFYCPAETENPIVCPNGTYGVMSGISNVSDCASCPPGQYCYDGEIQGLCEAGYICNTGSPTKTPLNAASSTCDYCICPKGYYCPEGIEAPIPCPGGSFGMLEGGMNSSVCGVCQPGDWCLDSSIEPIPCPPGNFCPNNATVKVPVPCPSGTYNEEESGASLDDCKPCVEGYYCPEAKTAAYQIYPCPTAHYCPTGSTSPVICPEGTFRDIQNGANISDCFECLPGYYCPPQSDHPLECNISEFCPSGTGATPPPCPAGRYCPKRTFEPEECPAGYYCPEGAEIPLFCPVGHYCPTNSSVPTLCPSGYRRYERTGLRVSVDDSCMICDAGTYGNHTLRQYCEPCGAGHVCLLGATQSNPTSVDEHRGYICPRGYTCPTGSALETPCSPGTFNPDLGLGTSTCPLCPDGTFAHLKGSLRCLPCGPSSASSPDRRTCNCIGNNRVYQNSDGACICKAGYSYFSGSKDISNQDSTFSCVPIVYDRCVRGQVRSYTGMCVEEGAEVCESACDEYGGVMNSDTKGICECNNVKTVQEVCDSTCRANRLKLRIRNGQFEIYDPVSDTILESYSTSIIAGSSSCIGTCNVEVTAMSGDGFLGVYRSTLEYYRSIFQNSTVPNKPILRSLVEEESTSLLPSDLRRHKRTIFSGTDIDGINEPVVCLPLGAGMIWDVSASRQNYPFYVKDSTLNSNLNFDSGPFRNLDILMQSNSTVTVFVYMFQESGTYVFANMGNPSKISIVKVMEAGLTCPDDQVFKPLLASNLATLSIVVSESPFLSPDFVLIAVLCVGFIIFLALLLVGVHYFRNRTWTTQFGARPKFKKSTLLSEYDKLMQNEEGEKTINLDRFNVRLFLDKLKKNESEVDDSLNDYKDDLDDKYSEILKEISLIKELLGKQGSGGAVNVNDVLHSLKPIRKPEDFGNAISQIESQKETIEKDGHSKSEIDIAHLEPEVAKQVLELVDENEKTRSELSKSYDTTLLSLKEIQSQYEKLVAQKNSKKQPAKYKEEIQNLKLQFNSILDEARNSLEEGLKKLNDGIAAKNSLMQNAPKDFTVNPESAERLRDFLQVTLREIFMDYREKQEQKNEEKKKEETPVEEEEEEVEEGEENEEAQAIDPPETANEIEQIQFRYRKQRREMKSIQQGELEQLDEDIDKEFLKEKEALEHHFSEESANLMNEIKQELKTKLEDPNLSEEERKIYIRDSKKRIDAVKSAMDREKANQIDMLTRLLEQKKAQKLKALQVRHELDKKNNREAEEKERKDMESLIKRVTTDASKYTDDKQRDIFSQTETLKGKLEIRKQNQAKAHLLEKMHIDEYIDKIDKVDRDVQKEKQTKLGEMKIENMEIIQKQQTDLLANKLSPEELQAYKEKQKAALKAYEEKIQKSAQEEATHMDEELKNRRALLTQQVENRRALAEQSEIKAEEKDLDRLRTLMESTMNDTDSINAAKSAARKRQEVEMQKKLLELQLRREEKKRMFDDQKEKEIQKIEVERDEQIENVIKKVEEDMQKKIAQKEQFLKQQLERTDISEKEKEKILHAHKMDIEDYKQKMEESKRKQVDEISKKMNERLERLKRAVDKKVKDDTKSDLEQQERLLDKNAKEQYQEIPKVHIELSKKAKEEVTALKEKHDNEVQALKQQFEVELKELEKETFEEKHLLEMEKLQKKHDKAKKALESQLQADLASNKDSEHERILKQYSADLEKLDRLHESQAKAQEEQLQKKLAKKRAELQKRHEEKLNNLKSDQRKETEKALTQQRKDAEKKKILDIIMDEKHKVGSIEDAISSVIFERQQRDLANLDSKQRAELKAASPQDVEALKLKHLDERVKLKKKHLQEKNEFVQDFAKYKDLIKQGNADQQKMHEDMEYLHNIIMKQKEANIARVERQKQALREQMQKDIEEEARKAKEEEENMRKKLEKAKNEMQVELLVQEAEKQQQELIAQQKNLENDERLRLMEQYQLNLSAFEEALDAERIRQEDILRQRIEAAEAIERKKRLDEALEKMNAQFTGKRLKKKSSDKDAEQAPSSIISSVNSNRFDDTISKFKKLKSADDFFPKEKNWVTPLYQRIKNIESQVLSEKRAYIDSEDAVILENEGSLTIITDSSLSLTQLLVCRFGHYILYALQQKYRSMKRVKLLIAKTLPKTAYVRNAFKNSFFWDEESGTLFIRHTKLATVGKFVLCIVHCLAHIHCGNMFDDTHPDFLKYFYAFMSGVSEEFFTSVQISKYSASSEDNFNPQVHTTNHQVQHLHQHRERVVKTLVNLPLMTVQQHQQDSDVFLSKIKNNNIAVETAPPKIASEVEYLKFELNRLLTEKRNVSNLIQQVSNDIKQIQIELEKKKTPELESRLRDLQMRAQSHTMYLTQLSADVRKIEGKVSRLSGGAQGPGLEQALAAVASSKTDQNA